MTHSTGRQVRMEHLFMTLRLRLVWKCNSILSSCIVQVLEELSERCLIRYNKSSVTRTNKALPLETRTMMPEVQMKGRDLLQILARSEAYVQPTLPG